MTQAALIGQTFAMLSGVSFLCISCQKLDETRSKLRLRVTETQRRSYSPIISRHSHDCKWPLENVKCIDG